MATTTTTNYTSIPSAPSACVYAEMRYGTNGGGADPELSIGNSGTDATTGRMVWDNDNDEEPFDSGAVGFALAFPPGGGTSHPDTLTVNGAVTIPITYTLKTYGKISALIIVAGVQINAAVSFTGLNVAFYKSGALFETVNPTGPAVDTTSATNPVAAQVLTITPSTTLEGQVEITGTFEMSAPEGTYPDVNDLFGQIFIQTTSCN
jgi:hypothetical protein